MEEGQKSASFNLLSKEAKFNKSARPQRDGNFFIVSHQTTQPEDFARAVFHDGDDGDATQPKTIWEMYVRIPKKTGAKTTDKTQNGEDFRTGAWRDSYIDAEKKSPGDSGALGHKIKRMGKIEHYKDVRNAVSKKGCNKTKVAPTVLHSAMKHPAKQLPNGNWEIHGLANTTFKQWNTTPTLKEDKLVDAVTNEAFYCARCYHIGVEADADTINAQIVIEMQNRVDHQEKEIEDEHGNKVLAVRAGFKIMKLFPHNVQCDCKPKDRAPMNESDFKQHEIFRGVYYPLITSIRNNQLVGTPIYRDNHPGDKRCSIALPLDSTMTAGPGALFEESHREKHRASFRRFALYDMNRRNVADQFFDEYGEAHLHYPWNEEDPHLFYANPSLVHGADASRRKLMEEFMRQKAHPEDLKIPISDNLLHTMHNPMSHAVVLADSSVARHLPTADGLYAFSTINPGALVSWSGPLENGGVGFQRHDDSRNDKYEFFHCLSGSMGKPIPQENRTDLPPAEPCAHDALTKLHNLDSIKQNMLDDFKAVIEICGPQSSAFVESMQQLCTGACILVNAEPDATQMYAELESDIPEDSGLTTNTTATETTQEIQASQSVVTPGAAEEHPDEEEPEEILVALLRQQQESAGNPVDFATPPAAKRRRTFGGDNEAESL